MLEFIFDESRILFPLELLFNDESRQQPKRRVLLNGWRLLPKDFHSLARICSHLIELHIDHCSFASESLEGIRGLTQLAVFSMRSTIPITSPTAQVFGSWTGLVNLDISENRVDLSSISVIAMTCKRLRVLCLEACEGLDDVCLSRLGDMVQRFHVLKEISLLRCPDIRDEGVLALFQTAINGCTHISLGCTNCSTLGIVSLRRKTSTLRSLDVLQLQLTPSAFEWIAEGCSQLTYLNCSGCRALDDHSLFTIAKRCRQIQSIDVSSCGRLTDEGISRALLEGTPNLRYYRIPYLIRYSSAVDTQTSVTSSPFRVRLPERLPY